MMRATLTATGRIQTPAAMIEPSSNARIRTPTAIAATRSPPRINFKRSSGPGAARFEVFLIRSSTLLPGDAYLCVGTPKQCE
jgi:hypothetical protein